MEIKLTKNNFEEVLKNNKVVLVDFFATWCGPCKMMSPVIEEIAEDYDGKIVVGKIDVDEEAEIARKFNIMSIPTVYLFKDGVVKDYFVGYKNYSQLENFIKEVL